MTDIGKTVKEWEIVPLMEPKDEPAPVKEPAPQKVEPERTPEKVPA
jgi:hypothetical protein